jgi:hypothetical protein
MPADNVRTKESFEDVPEVTISHDQLANGRWRYKTSVTMRGTPDEVAKALELADTLARQEAARRTELDQSEVDQRIARAKA